MERWPYGSIDGSMDGWMATRHEWFQMLSGAARDGTAVGRHGGAPREHVICSGKTVPNMNPGMVGKI